MKYFVIVGTQRTGSSALAEAISLHPKIASGWEWTQKKMPYSLASSTKSALLEHEFSVLDPHNRMHSEKIFNENLSCFGFRRLFRSSSKWLFSPKLSIVSEYERLRWHMDWFVENNIFVIHIVRNNNMSWLKSKAIAKKTKNFHGEPYKEGIQAVMNTKEAMKRIQAKHWIDKQLSSLSGKTPYLQVQYESFQQNNTLEAQRVIQFLGEDEALLPSLSETMKLKRQSSKPDIELLGNYHEIESLLSKHGLLTYI